MWLVLQVEFLMHQLRMLTKLLRLLREKKSRHPQHQLGWQLGPSPGEQGLPLLAPLPEQVCIYRPTAQLSYYPAHQPLISFSTLDAHDTHSPEEWLGSKSCLYLSLYLMQSLAH